jgi:hypothetical protein
MNHTPPEDKQPSKKAPRTSLGNVNPIISVSSMPPADNTDENIKRDNITPHYSPSKNSCTV